MLLHGCEYGRLNNESVLLLLIGSDFFEPKTLPAHPLCFFPSYLPFELENYHAKYYTHSRSENEYTRHEPYPD